MRIHTVKGIIDRRILINFIADREVVQKIIPKPFRPKVYKDKAIVGICLIRLKQMRPKGFPPFIGIGSENGAHRIAVEWNENGQIKEGVFIPRRDTSSLINSTAGGRIFPGKHYHARFDVEETDRHYRVAFKSSDNTSISIDAVLTEKLSNESIFNDIEEVSEFFRNGSTGFSPNGKNYEGLKLNTLNWEVKPLKLLRVHSSYFEDETLFPKGSIQFDNALLMTQIHHEWKSVGRKSGCECIAE